jgi:hypothetical protein
MAKSKSYASRSKSLARSPEPSAFSYGFGGVLGGLAAMAVVGVVCITLFAIGYYLLTKYNKKGTKLFEDLQPMQYVGITLCVIACIPFLQYFFMGLLFNAGGAAFSSMFE